LAAAGGRPPNVLLILTDDQGWFDLGAHGNPYIETPNLDRLAAESVRFSHFHASPVCSPTRAALMTGRHYQRTGCIDTYMGRDVLRAGETTLGQVFQQAGYRTACIGKWHLGRYMRYHPNQRGFEEYFGFWQYGFIQHYDDPDELVHNRRPVSATGYITNVFTDRAIDFIRAAGSRPWFLYLAYNAPHSPHLAPEAYIERYLKKGLPLREARIYAMVTAIDDNIARLLKTVDAANTVVVFMTDNGGVSRFHKCGLRGQKGSVWEGGVRVPFFARWPGQFPAGKVIPSMAQHIDVFPTLCELIGARAPQGRPLDGRSLLPLLRAGRGESPHQHLFHQWQRVRPAPESGAVRDARGYKLHIGPGALYDLNSDPGEERNLAAQHPALARSLRAEFDRWFEDVTRGQDYSRVPIEVGRTDENPVEIDLTWGEPVGQKVLPTYRSYNRDIVDRWTEPGDAVRWKIDVVEAGRYEVTLTYGCRPADAGSRLAVLVGPARLEYKVAATAGREVFEPRVAGHLDLAKGPATLEIRPVSVAGAELMALHKIWLRKL
jgi:arylsulfatase A